MADRFINDEDWKIFQNFKTQLNDPAKPLFVAKDVITLWRIIHQEMLDPKRDHDFIEHCVGRLNRDRDDACLYQ